MGRTCPLLIGLFIEGWATGRPAGWLEWKTSGNAVAPLSKAMPDPRPLEESAGCLGAPAVQLVTRPQSPHPSHPLPCPPPRHSSGISECLRVSHSNSGSCVPAWRLGKPLPEPAGLLPPPPARSSASDAAPEVLHLGPGSGDQGPGMGKECAGISVRLLTADAGQADPENSATQVATISARRPPSRLFSS